ncbi:carboxypeptidase-like regulatory domain-containing protein [Hymenobacter humi]|uniref:Carboxypeptidase-like regulatory domain-containing protein n=1 Tax=Hymenobacter humi TaxID=1411620 RepID=A0ABW2UF66_9BACT
MGASFTVLAQSGGTIRGTVREAKTQEPVIGASVVVDGTSIGIATDLDGTFSLAKVPAGMHTLRITRCRTSPRASPACRWKPARWSWSTRRSTMPPQRSTRWW